MSRKEKNKIELVEEHDLRSPLSYAYDNRLLLQWLVFLRVVVATFIIATIFMVNYPEERHIFYVLIGTHVLVSLLFALSVQTFSESRWFLTIQIYWDILFNTVLIYLSGGHFSVFTFLYVIAVIYSSIILSRTAAILSAVVCVLSFGTILIMQWLNLIVVPNSGADQPQLAVSEMIYKLALNALAIFAATFLSSFLSEHSKGVSAELKRKRQDLVELKARFEHMIRSIPIGLIALDEDEKIVFANSSAAGILNIQNSNMENKSIRDVFPLLPEKPLSEISRREIRYDRGEENLFLEVTYSSLNSGQDAPRGGLVVFEDRTSVKSMEAAVERSDRLAAVGKLATGIAHEIRNPLASISGSIQLLSNELHLDAVNRQLMDIVIRESERVNALVSDFLSFARPSANIQCLVEAKVITDEVVKMLSGQQSIRENVHIHQNLEDRMYVRADPKNLRQLLWNLAINAVQAMPDGGDLSIEGRVIQQKTDDREEKMVEISFTDTGVGMNESTMKNIFDPFFTTKESGTGLGLTMCHNIVEMYNGKISVKSRPGRGSKFIVHLPAAERAGSIQTNGR